MKGEIFLWAVGSEVQQEGKRGAGEGSGEQVSTKYNGVCVWKYLEGTYLLVYYSKNKWNNKAKTQMNKSMCFSAVNFFGIPNMKKFPRKFTSGFERVY